jgi:hypothetical protein
VLSQQPDNSISGLAEALDDKETGDESALNLQEFNISCCHFA